MSEQPQKIVALVDGSVYSASVCDHAAWMSARTGAPVELIHVLGRREAPEKKDLSGAIALGARTALLEELAELDAQRAKLVSHRGRNGGVSLAHAPQDLRIGDVVRVLEPNMQIADCPKCKLRPECSARDMFDDALAAFMAVLDARTLAQAARSRGTGAADVQP